MGVLWLVVVGLWPSGSLGLEVAEGKETEAGEIVRALWAFGLSRAVPQLQVLRDASPFSESLLSQLSGRSSLRLVSSPDSSSLVPGRHLLFISQRPEDLFLDFRPHEGPLFALFGFKPSFNRSEKPTVFLHVNSWYFFYSDDTLYSVDRDTLEVEELSESRISYLENAGPFEDVFKKRVIVRSFNCTIFAAFGAMTSSGPPEWCEGVEMKFFETLAERMHLNWTVWEADGYGSKQPDGSWTPGIHKEITIGTGDVGFCQVWLSLKDVHLVDFVDPWDLHCLRFMVPRPVAARPHWAAPLRTYQLPVWAATLSSAILASITFKLFDNARLSMGYPKSGLTMSYLSLLYTSLCNLAQAGFPSPTSLRGSLRPLVLSWVFLALLLAVGYSCNLVADLTKAHSTTKLNSIQDLLSKGCKWGINGYYENFEAMKQDDDPTYVKFWNHYVGDIENKDKVDWRKFDCYAELGESNGNLFYVPKGQTVGLYETHEASTECLVGHLYTFYIKRASPLTAPLRKLAMLLRETGIAEKITLEVVRSARLRHFIVQNAFIFSHPPQGSFTKLDFHAVKGCLFILAFGLAVASLSFLVELAASSKITHLQE